MATDMEFAEYASGRRVMTDTPNCYTPSKCRDMERAIAALELLVKQHEEQSYRYEAEIAALKAENERLKPMCHDESLTVTALKAERDSAIKELSVFRGRVGYVEYERDALKAEVERLRKAASEALSALYGAMEITGSIGNMAHAIGLLRAALKEGE